MLIDPKTKVFVFLTVGQASKCRFYFSSIFIIMVGRLSICCTILGCDFNPTRFVNVHVNIFVNVVDLHGKSITVVQQPGLDIFEPQQEPKCCIPLLTESGKARKSWPSEVCSARNIAPASASWRQWHSWRRSDHTNHPGEWQESHK